MKSIVLSSVVTALLVFSGCSSKEPAVDTESKKAPVEEVVAQEVETVQTETVAASESMVESSSNASGQLSMSEVEEQLSSIYFAFDKYNLNSKMQDRVTAAAELGKTGASAYNVKLEGNCDEWGSDEYNFALGLKRAVAVKEALVAEGVDASRISMVSYGESNPTCSDKTSECFAKNRRVEFKLLP